MDNKVLVICLVFLFGCQQEKPKEPWVNENVGIGIKGAIVLVPKPIKCYELTSGSYDYLTCTVCELIAMNPKRAKKILKKYKTTVQCGNLIFTPKKGN